MTTTWTNLQVCEPCWEKKEGTRQPVRLKGVQTFETCFACGEGTSSGIYVRVKVEWP